MNKPLFDIEETTANTKKYMRFTPTHVEILDPQMLDKMGRKPLSASLITGLEGCHAKWAFQSFVEPVMFPQPKTNEASKGQFFHSIMEEFFSLDGPERSKGNLYTDVVEKVLAMPDYQHFAEDPETLQWAKDSIEAYYEAKMDEDPKNVKIAELNRDGKTEKGLEIKVSGTIHPDQKNRLFGYVDRVTEDQDGNLIVEDWKSGKKKHWAGKKFHTEGWNEQRQQVIYAMLLEKEGHNVSRARLLYPYAQHVEPVETSSPKIREQVTKDILEADHKFETLKNTNSFDFSPRYCAWCPLVNICPSAVVYGRTTSEKVKNALNNQPTPEELVEGIEFA